jgi:hypothetical protein
LQTLKKAHELSNRSDELTVKGKGLKNEYTALEFSRTRKNAEFAALKEQAKRNFQTSIAALTKREDRLLALAQKKK